MVSDVVSTPKDHVITDRRKWLHHIVSEDKTVFAQFYIAPNKSFSADITRGSVAALLHLEVEPSSGAVQLSVNNRREEVMLISWILRR